MITCKESDYITISVLPENSEVEPDVLLNSALKALYLDELWNKNLFEYMCESKYYTAIYRFSDIQVKIALEDKYKRNGICFEFSGGGLDYYREYLATHYNKVDLRKVARRFVALSDVFEGIKTTASRFDVAFDEKYRKGEQVEPLLTLSRVEDCFNKRAFVSKFRKSDTTSSKAEIVPFFMVEPAKCDKSLPYKVITSRNLSTGREGKTIELGRRKSNSFVRIYDKLVEQEVKGADVSDLSHWVRFEMEFKQTAACAVFMDFATANTAKEFSDKMRGKALELIKFVDLDRSRLYNCTVCSWWIDFLQNVQEYHLVNNKPTRNKYLRALNNQKKRNASSLVALMMCNRKNVMSIIIEGINHITKTSSAIVNDYKALQEVNREELQTYIEQQNEKLVGFDHWRQFYNCASEEEFSKLLYNDIKELQEELDKAFAKVAAAS